MIIIMIITIIMIINVIMIIIIIMITTNRGRGAGGAARWRRSAAMECSGSLCRAAPSVMKLLA